MILPITSLDSKLITLLERENITLGLANGKMGYCIYFYHLSLHQNNQYYKSIADKILDNIFDNINKVNSLDILNGLSGMGLGINYLVNEKFAYGNINETL